MEIVTYDGIDSGALLQAAAAVASVIYLAPGYHKITSNTSIPADRTIIGHGAHIEITGSDFLRLPGNLILKGGTYFGGTDSAHRLAASTVNGSISAYDVTFEHGVRVSCSVLNYFNMTDCVVHGRAEFKDSTLKEVDFYGGHVNGSSDQRNGDIIFTGQMNVSQVRFHECRMVSIHPGLHDSTFLSLTWYFKSGIYNQSEAIVLENCDVIDNTFSNLHFHGCKTCINLWNSSDDAKTYTGNVFDGGTADTASRFIWLYNRGASTNISGNTFKNFFVKDVMCGIEVGDMVGANTFQRINMTSGRLNAMSENWFALPHDTSEQDPDELGPSLTSGPPLLRFMINDHGTSPSTYSQIYISDLNGSIPSFPTPITGVTVYA